jgi:hypothetical protein
MMLGATFFVKPVQELETDSTMAFLSIPVTAAPSIVKELVDTVLRPLELEPTKENPVPFLAFRHCRSNWVKYRMVKSLAFGMPFEKYNNTERESQTACWH